MECFEAVQAALILISLLHVLFELPLLLFFLYMCICADFIIGICAVKPALTELLN
jgi:hypothetical protein